VAQQIRHKTDFI